MADLSRHLIADLSRLTAPNNLSFQTPSWPDCEAILISLQAFLPKSLPDSVLNTLDPRQHKHAVDSKNTIMQWRLLKLIHEELCLHNQAVIFLHASHTVLLSFLRGQTMYSASMGTTLSSLCANEIPQQWHAHLPRPLSEATTMVSALRLLRLRLASYRTILENGSPPSSLDSLLLSNPEELFSMLAGAFAASCEIERSFIETEVEVHKNIHVVADIHASPPI